MTPTTKKYGGDDDDIIDGGGGKDTIHGGGGDDIISATKTTRMMGLTPRRPTGFWARMAMTNFTVITVMTFCMAGTTGMSFMAMKEMTGSMAETTTMFSGAHRLGLADRRKRL